MTSIHAHDDLDFVKSGGMIGGNAAVVLNAIYKTSEIDLRLLKNNIRTAMLSAQNMVKFSNSQSIFTKESGILQMLQSICAGVSSLLGGAAASLIGFGVGHLKTSKERHQIEVKTAQKQKYEAMFNDTIKQITENEKPIATRSTSTNRTTLTNEHFKDFIEKEVPTLFEQKEEGQYKQYQPAKAEYSEVSIGSEEGFNYTPAGAESPILKRELPLNEIVKNMPTPELKELKSTLSQKVNKLDDEIRSLEQTRATNRQIWQETIKSNISGITQGTSEVSQGIMGSLKADRDAYAKQLDALIQMLQQTFQGMSKIIEMAEKELQNGEGTYDQVVRTLATPA